jgi:small-conductance mechanosensitive channel
MLVMGFTQRNWLFGILLLAAVVIFGNGFHYVLFRVLRRRETAKQRRDFGLQHYLGKPARGVLLSIAVITALPFVPGIPAYIFDRIEQIAEIMLVLFLGWLAVGSIYVFEAVMMSRFDESAEDNLRARQVRTQLLFFRRLLIIMVVILDAGALLWSLHDARLWKYGTGLLASAGLASLVLATAAKTTASNLLAGMQIALSEPIRIGDVVVIQGEWGRIEEITSTYVVVAIWDERRLIVPLSQIIEQPFTNWTRHGSNLLGTAFLYVDYSVPVEPLRAELTRIVSESPLWDKRVVGLQVTNLTERTMELRCLVSTSNSSKGFDLRCLVREKMIEFLKANYPQALPTLRMEMKGMGEKTSEPAEQPSLILGPAGGKDH